MASKTRISVTRIRWHRIKLAMPRDYSLVLANRPLLDRSITRPVLGFGCRSSRPEDRTAAASCVLLGKEHRQLLVDPHVRPNAIEYQACRNLCEFFRFHLMQPSPIHAALAKKLRRSGALKSLKHTHVELRMLF